MKNIKLKGLFAIIIPLFLYSCSTDFIEAKKDLSGVNDQVFQNEALGRAYVDYIYYSFLPGDGSNMASWDLTSGGNDDFSQTTDELGGETNWNKEWAQISSNENHCLKYIGDKVTTSKRNNTWTRLKQINIYLTEVDNYSGIEEEAKNQLKGQLYFWRAYQYYDLLKLYGGVPLVLEPQNPIIGDEGLEVPRSSSSETLEQIVSDLDMAKSLLPEKWADSDDWGRITSGGAAAFKGRVLLTWASPLFNRQDEAQRWQLAYDANLEAKNILEASGYGLASSWGDMWFSDVNNPEAVISWGFNNTTADRVGKSNGTEKASRSKAQNGSGSVSPTKQVVDAFPMKDGRMPGDNTGTYTYDPNKFYKDRDPRFYNTFAYNGAAWPYKEDPSFKNWTYYWYKNAGDETPSGRTETLGSNATGIYLKKFTNESASSNDNFSFSGTDYMELRFAEVILNLAESAIGVGKLAEGKDGIMLIRERAGIENNDGSYGLANVSGRDALFGAVINERRVEFAYENKRFWDLRRWLLFNDDFNTVSRLGQTPIDGSRRQGYYTIAKDMGADYNGSADPFLPNVKGDALVISREPESYPVTVGSTTLNNYDEYLDYLYDNYFEVIVKDDIDKSNGWTFQWYDEYYFFGIYDELLNTAPYLEQTVGWGGSFDPRAN